MIGLILANLVPLAGVVLLDWDAFAVVALYWFENVVIGVLNIVKMIACCPQEPSEQAAQETHPGRLAAIDSLTRQAGSATPVWAAHAIKLFIIPFFAVHYGLFTFVHGAFVFTLFGGMDAGAAGPFDAGRVRLLAEEGLLWAALALAASHVAVLLQDYFWNGGFRRTNPMALMFEPYPRVIVLHVAIIVGAMLAFAFGSPAWLLVVLIAGKTMLDIALFRRLREARATEGPDANGLDDPLLRHESPSRPAS
ncbi:hypothetical protein Pla175_32950 [Pirellulimonas nuda]|uniref:Uncharacterized protein n=1 Tax=Pirellulimonas nuda TaxID=2528009 RepID=A0A518DEJ3_9BACT|nr:DUF6498-containing protein [Pirellulimonas nuda]QDU89898.1 hypothetical protein Pla175_32950 [Pirellulimonas nuda]